MTRNETIVASLRRCLDAGMLMSATALPSTTGAPLLWEVAGPDWSATLTTPEVEAFLLVEDVVPWTRPGRVAVRSA